MSKEESKWVGCSTCKNFLTGTLHGFAYKCCAGRIDNPERCVMRKEVKNGK